MLLRSSSKLMFKLVVVVVMLLSSDQTDKTRRPLRSRLPPLRVCTCASVVLRFEERANVDRRLHAGRAEGAVDEAPQLHSGP